MEGKNIILIGSNGRESMRQVWSSMTTESELLSRFKSLKTKAFYFKNFKNKDFTRSTRISNKDISIFDSTVIKWGNAIDIPIDSKSIVYNNSSAILLASNKKRSRIELNNAGVSVPRIVSGSGSSVGITFPIIARPSRHSKGKDFVILGDLQALRNHMLTHNQSTWYYSCYVDKDIEFRVHCGHGKVIAVMEKPRPSDGSLAWNRTDNEEEGFRYVNWNKVNEETLMNACYQSLLAVKTLGLDMGGVDVVCKGTQAYVLEVNTSPDISTGEYIYSRWAKYFDWIFSSKERRFHWDFESKKKGISLIWKNKQLKNI